LGKVRGNTEGSVAENRSKGCWVMESEIRTILERNYVIFVCTDTDATYIFRDLHGNPRVRIINKAHFFHNKFLSLAFRFCFSQVMNNHFPMRIKRVWFGQIVRACRFGNDDPVVFVFNQGWYDEMLVSWLKANHPEFLLGIYFDDTIAFCKSRIHALDPFRLKQLYDFVLSYNSEDVERYGYTFSPVYFSKIPVGLLPQEERGGLVFIGQPKDRLPLLLQIYEKLHPYVVCRFILAGKRPSGDSSKEGIVYRNSFLSYLSYIGCEVASDCILEIIKGDTKGCSYRVWEAVYYNKKLLTN
jgi:hypothetical protein